MQAKVTSKELLNSLRRRIKQMTSTKNFAVNTQATVNISCNNNCSLSWESAIETISTKIEKSNTSRWNRLLHKFLSISELIQLANLPRASTAVSMGELLFYVPSRFKDLSIIANQLLSHLPLLLVKKLNSQYLINMHEVELGNPKLDSAFQIPKSNDSIPIATVQKEKGKGRNGGRIPILQRFPDVSHVATEFIKTSGFKAQEKRRESTITSCGVSLKNITEHFIKEIPGLSEHGTSEMNVRYLFNPVNKIAFTVARYKSVIDAAVPCKDNS